MASTFGFGGEPASPAPPPKKVKAKKHRLSWRHVAIAAIVAVITYLVLFGWPTSASAQTNRSETAVPVCQLGTAWAINPNRALAEGEKFITIVGSGQVLTTTQRERPGSSRLLLTRCKLAEGMKYEVGVGGIMPWFRICGQDFMPEGWTVPEMARVGPRGPQGEPGSPGPPATVPTAPPPPTPSLTAADIDAAVVAALAKQAVAQPPCSPEQMAFVEPAATWKNDKPFNKVVFRTTEIERNCGATTAKVVETQMSKGAMHHAERMAKIDAKVRVEEAKAKAKVDINAAYLRAGGLLYGTGGGVSWSGNNTYWQTQEFGPSAHRLAARRR